MVVWASFTWAIIVLNIWQAKFLFTADTEIYSEMFM